MTTFHGEGGERKFVCKPCNEEYLSKDDLQEHVRSLPHIQTVRSLEDSSSVSELFQAGVQLDVLTKGELEDLPMVKEEVSFITDMNKANSQVYTIADEDGSIKAAQILSGESPSHIVVDSLADVVLTDKGNKIYVLKNLPEKMVANQQE